MEGTGQTPPGNPVRWCLREQRHSVARHSTDTPAAIAVVAFTIQHTVT